MSTPAYSIHMNNSATKSTIHTAANSIAPAFDVSVALEQNLTTFKQYTTELDSLGLKLRGILASLSTASDTATTSAPVGSGGAAAATADVKNKAESNNMCKQIARGIDKIVNNLPCYGALETHLNMLFHTDQIAYSSVRENLMSAIRKLKDSTDKINEMHHDKKKSAEMVEVVRSLSNLSTNIVNMLKFLDLRIPNEEPNIPGGHTSKGISAKK